jgi:hypothetical protein
MPASSPQTRFLLRGSAALLLMLALWWLLLLNPLLFLLRGSVSVFGPLVLGASREFVRETPQGDWTVRTPLEATVPGQTGATAIRSIDFDIARSDVAAFTFSLPVYWAIMLAAPGIRRSLRPLFYGTLLTAALEIGLFLTFAKIFAHKTVAGLASPGVEANWGLRFGEYLVVTVIPYVAPFLLALALRPDLRSQVLRWASANPAPTARRQRRTG